jgi:predicted XRE-type DNA-binding protein
MTRRNPDAITLAEAAQLLGLTEMRVSALRREGLLVRLRGYPSYSRVDVQEFIDNPWIDGAQAAILLGVSRTRVSQVAGAEKIPVHRTRGGRRVYRLKQLEVVANARALKFRASDPSREVPQTRPSSGLATP